MSTSSLHIAWTIVAASYWLAAVLKQLDLRPMTGMQREAGASLAARVSFRCWASTTPFDLRNSVRAVLGLGLTSWGPTGLLDRPV